MDEESQDEQVVEQVLQVPLLIVDVHVRVLSQYQVRTCAQPIRTPSQERAHPGKKKKEREKWVREVQHKWEQDVQRLYY